jgi:hypothetical protein
MATIDILIPTYRGIAPEAYSALIAMMQETNCTCRNSQGAPAHDPWKCPNGKHSVRFMPPLFQSSVVHWARNWCVAQAMYGQPKDGRPPADYFLLMDDDMVTEPKYLKRLLAYKTDIVCGICTVRKDPPRPNIRFWNPALRVFADPIEWDWDAQKLIEVDAAGAAFMLVKRAVFERMCKAYLECEFEIENDEKKADSPDIREYWQERSQHRKRRFAEAFERNNWQLADFWPFQFLTDAVEDQIGELGEDIAFCWKAKRLGFKIYADPQVLPGHLGSYSYSIRDYRDLVEQSKAEGQMPAPRENRVALEV